MGDPVIPGFSSLDEACAQAGKVVLPAGDFEIASSVLLANGLVLEGAGTEVTRIVFTGIGSALIALRSRFVLRDLTIYSKSVVSTSGLRLQGSMFSIVENVKVDGGGRGFTTAGIELVADGEMNSARSNLIECEVVQVKGHGVYVQGYNGITITGGHYHWLSGYGLYQDSYESRVSQVRCFGGTFEGCQLGQIYGDTLRTSVFIGTHCENGVGSTNPLVVLGKAGACVAVSFIGCSLSGHDAEYCVDARAQGMNQDLVFSACNMSLTSEAGIAFIRAQKWQRCLVAECYPHRGILDPIDLIEIGHSVTDLVVRE